MGTGAPSSSEDTVGTDEASTDRLDRLTDILVVTGLSAMAVVTRFEPLGPASLWPDDAWRGVVVRTDNLGDFSDVMFTTPGFAAMLRSWFAVVGFSETRAQMLPFIAGVLTPALLYWWWRRSIGRTGALLFGGLLVAAPQLMVESTRVKHYSIEVLIAGGLACLALHVGDRPDDGRRWAALTGVAAIATTFSASLALVVAGAFAGAWLGVLRDRGSWRRALAATLAYGVFVVGWALLVIAPRSTDTLREYWSHRYISLADGFFDAAGQLLARLRELSEGFSVLPATLLVVAIALSLAVLAIWRPILAAITAVPLALAVAAAVLDQAPLGGGRTDLYLYVPVALAIAAAASMFAADVPVVRAGAMIAIVTLVAATPPVPRYPEMRISPLIRTVEDEAGPEDRILVHPNTHFAYALYTRVDPRFSRSDVRAPGFQPEIADPRVALLPSGPDRASQVPADVCQAVDGATKVWYIGAYQTRGEDLGAAEAALVELGFEQTAEQRGGRSWLSTWERDGRAPAPSCELAADFAEARSEGQRHP